MNRNLLNAPLWGISIALSWTWGLGLFFSVQISLQFGLPGLLCFAIPNAIGLMGFGILTRIIARKFTGEMEFENHFLRVSNALRFVFLAYQLVAITLTFFAIFRYLFAPLGVDLSLVVLLVLGAALMLGENFNISRIKWSHLAMFVVIAVCMTTLAVGLYNYVDGGGRSVFIAESAQDAWSWSFLGFVVPMVCGLLFGPWLDLQQWHRAIQIHREKTSLAGAYVCGGVLFFGILLFHGTIALLTRSLATDAVIVPARDGLFHAKDAVVRFLFLDGEAKSWIFRYSYVAFLCLCIISTLDSGYVSLKWYLRHLVKQTESVIATLIPPTVLASPIPSMLLAVVAAALSVPLRFELEYFMSFYASFSIAYSIVFLFRSVFEPKFTNFTQTTLFSLACFSLGVFGIGYFNEIWFFMAAGSLFPLVYGLTVISARVAVDDLQKALPPRDGDTEPREDSVSGKAAEMAVGALESAIARIDPRTAEKFHSVLQRVEPQAAQILAQVLSSVQPGPLDVFSIDKPKDQNAENEHAQGHFEGKWFTHTLMATYSDTNSVGNIYFGQYVMWIGKVREMFFRCCMPGFDLSNTPFYILTRQIEHKFNTEAKEFDLITIRIKIGPFNRKFATLEHEILNAAGTVLGKGKQVLLFVSSKDYSIVDLPNEVKVAFLPHV